MWLEGRWARCWLGAACLACSLTAAGQGKLAYVDTARIYAQSQAAKKVDAVLQQEFDGARKRLAALAQELETARSRAGADAVRDLELRYRREEQRLREEYDLRRSERFAVLQQTVGGLIRSLAKQEGYDLIVSEAAYADPRCDITDRVIRLLDGR